MTITEITNQPISSIIGIYLICKQCGVVDRDLERMSLRRPCTRCGLLNDAARMYFPGSALSMMDLMQEFYHGQPQKVEEPGVFQYDTRNNHHLAVIIFFCTFFDLLLEHFLRQKMIAAKLPLEIQDRMLDDSRYTMRRIERLFPTLTGSKWSEAVSIMRARAELDYEDSVAFYQRVREIRNRLVHEGAKWSVPAEMPKQCIEQLHSLVSLFVALHNEYCLTRPAAA